MTATLPEIVVNGRPLRELTAEAFETLMLANEPPDIFVRHGRLVRVRRDEKRRPVVEELFENQVRHHLARVAEFVRVGDKGTRSVVPPPPMVVGDLLAMPAWPGLPALEALIEVPILRADGTVLDVPGYDSATGLVYCPAPGLSIPAIPAAPTRADAERAMTVVADLFDDMPFAGDADLANLLALLITPIVRPAIAGQVPMALVDKPKRGTGATLCVQVVAAIAFGSITELQTAPHDDDEWRKKITSALLAGRTLLWFDNVETELSSASLAAVLTAPEWTDRILGKSEMTRPLPQRATWVATGNNLKVGGDLGRRCYRIRLDAGIARPWQRDGFKHPQLLRHVLRHRGDFLAAILTAARGWFAAGCPGATVPKIGGFDEWAETVGGILAYAGIDDFLANLNALYDEVDTDEVVWEGLLAAWHARFGSEPIRVAQVKDALADGAVELREALPDDLVEALEAQKGFTRRLGTALARRAGAVFGEFGLDRAGSSHRASLWKVSLASPVSHFRAKPESQSGHRKANPAETDSPDSPDAREPGDDDDDPSITCTDCRAPAVGGGRGTNGEVWCRPCFQGRLEGQA
jgi:hypothetical protein